MPVIQLDERRKQPPDKPPRKPIGSGWLVALGFVVIVVVAFVYFLVTAPR